MKVKLDKQENNFKVLMVDQSYKKMFYQIFLIKILLLIFCVPHLTSAQQVEGSVSIVGDTTHLEFKGLNEWKFDLKKESPLEYSLLIPPINLPSEVGFNTFSNSLIDSIKVDKNGPDGQYILKIKVTNPNIDSFDYLTEQPSRLIVDFFKLENNPEKSKISVTDLNVNKKQKLTKKKNVKTVKNTNDYTKREIKRDPAGGEILQGEVLNDKNLKSKNLSKMNGIFDGNDPHYSRFQLKDYEINEEAIIASRQNIYIEFPMLDMPSGDLARLVENSPEYAIIPKDNEENKHARLLLTLFIKNRRAAFLKSYDFYKTKFPDSMYEEILRNISAEVHYSLYLENKDDYHLNQSRAEYEYLIAKYPGSPLTQRSELFLANLELERGDNVNALQKFQKFIDNHPNSEQVDLAKRAIASALLKLEKYSDASKAYKDLEKTALKSKNGIEGQYRLGDVDFSQKKYSQAIEKYKNAIDRFEEFESVFPNALYNMAESYFWLGDYKNSLNKFIKFLESFPSHEHGGYALTRIGEIMEIVGADRSKMMGALLECYFKYRTTPGAKVARVRMLSQRMKSMKEKELDRSILEMKEIASTSKLPQMNEFVTLMVASGLHSRKNYLAAMDQLITYYRANPTSSSLPFFHQRIVRYIADDVKEKIDNKDFLSALKIYSENSETWMNNIDRYDLPYFLGKAYELAGAFDASLNLYQDLYKKVKAISGTKAEKERLIYEHMPSVDELNVRIAKVLTDKRDYTQANEYLDRVKNISQLSKSSQVDWMTTMAKLSEEAGRTQQALEQFENLSNVWSTNNELLIPLYNRIGEMQMKLSKWKEAADSFSKVVELNKNGVSVTDQDLMVSMEGLGNSLLKQNKKLESVDQFISLLDRFEQKKPLDNLRYKVGSILFEMGDVKGAKKVWSQFPNENKSVYKKIADERLAQTQWSDEYKRYINRIPAMATMGQEK